MSSSVPAQVVESSNFKPEEHHVMLTTMVPWHGDVWLGVGAALDAMGVETELYTEECKTGFVNGVGKSCVSYGLVEEAYATGAWTKRE
jgi:hypothetical protein